MLSFDKVKLVIWDLDETLWGGVLSEGDIHLIDKNITLIKQLTDKGIVNSICSKNDFDVAKNKLIEIGIWEYFVFPSISWEPKGQRIKQLIVDMHLRNENVLFVDDNVSNIEECKFYAQGIMAKTPDAIDEIIDYLKSIKGEDPEHYRLQHYKVLEEKFVAREKSGSSVQFLVDSNIKIQFRNDCIEELDRIHELVLRTNQLNFTKNRMNKGDLLTLLNDVETESACVLVWDKFGDYGIVGFYACKNSKLIHFLFSCRTIGMGIEQFVYAHLNYPQLQIIDETASIVTNERAPSWISISCKDSESKNERESTGVIVSSAEAGNILIKGPCDISSAFTYLHFSGEIYEELTYINKDTGVTIEAYNHSCHVIQSLSIPDKRKKEIIAELPFSSPLFYSTEMFSGNYKIVFYSLLVDPSLGLYRRKKSNDIVAFGRYTYNLTDEKNWENLISHKIYTANCEFTIEFLVFFRENYEFIGRFNPEDIMTNVKLIRDKLPKDTVLILTLGAEIAYEKTTTLFYANRHEYNLTLNNLVRQYAKNTLNVDILDFSKIVLSQDDYSDSINHFSKQIYFEAAQEITSLIKKYTTEEIKYTSKYKLGINNVYDTVTHNKYVYFIGVRLKRFYFRIRKHILKALFFYIGMFN